jgi:predicted nucleic acid-binding protein
LCIDTDARGPRLTDAWFAALAIEFGCTWITVDRDFARFPGLTWRLPESG